MLRLGITHQVPWVDATTERGIQLAKGFDKAGMRLLVHS